MTAFYKIILVLLIMLLISLVTNCQNEKDGSNEKGIDYILQGKLDKAESQFSNVAHPDSLTDLYLGLIYFIWDQDIDDETGIHLLKGVIYSKEDRID